MNAADHELLQNLRDDLITLAGLSFGGSASALQGASRRLSRAIWLFGSGLLAADAPSRVKRTAQIIVELCASELCTQTLNWQCVDALHALNVAAYFLNRAFQHLKVRDLAAHPSEPPEEHLPSLVHTAAVLVKRSEECEGGDTHTVSDKDVALILCIVERVFESPIQNTVQDAQQLLDNVCQRCGASQTHLLARVWKGPLFALIRDMLNEEAALHDLEYQLRTAQRAPASQLALNFMRQLQQSVHSIDDMLPSLFAILLPLADDIVKLQQAYAMHMLQIVMENASDQALRFHRDAVLRALRSAIGAHHPATSVLAFPMLPATTPLFSENGTFLITDVPNKDWSDTFVEALQTLIHHVDCHDEDAHQHIAAATDIAVFIPRMAQSQLLSRLAAWSAVSAALIRRTAVFAASRRIEARCFTAVADSVIESLDWTSPRIAVYRAEIAQACLAAVMESRAGGDEVQSCVRHAATRILVEVGKHTNRSTFLDTLRALQADAARYPSLRLAKDLLEEVVRQLAQAGTIDTEEIAKTDASTSEKYGELVKRFFPADRAGLDAEHDNVPLSAYARS